MLERERGIGGKRDTGLDRHTKRQQGKSERRKVGDGRITCIMLLHLACKQHVICVSHVIGTGCNI